MLPIPKHLQDILSPTGEENSELQVSGIIRCACGCESFYTKIFASTDKGYPQVCEYGEGYALVIKAVCTSCKKEFLIFDKSLHGWNGFVCGDGINVPDEKLFVWNCSKCGRGIHNMEIWIQSQGRQDFIDESGIADGDDTFNADDWAEAFGWITISLACCGCGSINKNWIDYETM